jgi:putative ABC transport system permease protein
MQSPPNTAYSARLQSTWLLIRLAAQNVARRRVRALFLGLAIMLGVGVGFATFTTGWAINAGVGTSLARMGADLVVVPRNTLVNLTSSLLTVQPTEETLAATLADQLKTIPGVGRVAPQQIVQTLIGGRPINLIAFDPGQDFSVRPWLRERRSGPMTGDDLLVGGRLTERVGEKIALCDKTLEVFGRLGRTGVGPFDEAYFLTFEALRGLTSTTNQGAGSSTPCLRAKSGRVSAFLLQLAPSAQLEQVKFTIAQLPDIKVVEGNSVLTASRQSLGTLLAGVGVFTGLLLLASLILIALLFSAIIQERYREIGLLRAMGAKPRQVMSILLAEASLSTVLGGLGGLGFGICVLLLFERSIAQHFLAMGVPFVWPPLEVIATTALGFVLLSGLLGVLGALLPAWRVCRIDPYVLIQSEGK